MAVNFRPFQHNKAFGLATYTVLILAAASAASAQPKYANKLAPYVPSPQPVVERMLQLAGVKAGDTVFDLGCGDGRVLVTAAQKYNAHAVGIEISDKLVEAATKRINNLGLQEQIKVIKGDLRTADLTGADVVVMYLLTGSNEEIRPRLEKFLKPGARVVSYSYAVPGWKPALVDKTDERHGHTIYLYEIPASVGK